MAPGLVGTALLYVIDWDTHSARVGPSIAGHIFLATLLTLGLSIVLWPTIFVLTNAVHFLKRKVGRTVVAVLTKDYETLRSAVITEGLGEDFASQEEGEDPTYDWTWRRHYKSQRTRLAITIVMVSLSFLGLCAFFFFAGAYDVEKISLGLNGLLKILVIAAVVSIYFWLKPSKANPSSGLGLVLGTLELGIQEPSTAWETHETKRLTIRKGSVSFELTLTGRPGHADLVVQKALLPSHISLAALRPDIVMLEKHDINLGDIQWDRASLLNVTKKTKRNDHPCLWFPPEVRTLLLPLLALGCRVQKGRLEICDLPVRAELGKQVVEAIELVTALLARWQVIHDTDSAERPFRALRDERNNAVRRVLIDAVHSSLARKDFQALSLRWALEGKGPTRIVAASHLSSPKEKTQALSTIVQQSMLPAVQAEALGALWELDYFEGERLVFDLGQEGQADVIYELALKHPPKGSVAPQSPWLNFPSRTDDLVTIHPHLAPSLALIALHAGVSFELTTTWFTWALKAPVPQHLGILRAGRKLLEDKAAPTPVWLGPGERRPKWRDECAAVLRGLESELETRLEREAKTAGGHLSLATTDDEGQLSIVEDGNLSLADTSENTPTSSS